MFCIFCLFVFMRNVLVNSYFIYSNQNHKKNYNNPGLYYDYVLLDHNNYNILTVKQLGQMIALPILIFQRNLFTSTLLQGLGYML